MTCKDCIYEKMCCTKHNWLKPITLTQLDWEYEEQNLTTAYHCRNFKDKSKYIELPCKFRQKVYVLPTIDNNLLDMEKMTCIGFSLSAVNYNANLMTNKNKLYQPCFGDFGKTIFLTKSEAEAKLKELKENA